MENAAEATKKSICDNCEKAREAYSIILTQMGVHSEKLAILCLFCGSIWRKEELEELEVGKAWM